MAKVVKTPIMPCRACDTRGWHDEDGYCEDCAECDGAGYLKQTKSGDWEGDFTVKLP